MITALVGAISMIGKFLYDLAVDYISNIVVSAIVFPAQVIEMGIQQTTQLLLKPLL